MVLFRHAHKSYFDPRLLELMADEKSYTEAVNMLESYPRSQHSPELQQLQDSVGANLLHHAAGLGNARVVQYLLNSNFKIDAKDILGRTPLMLAVQEHHENVFEVLLKANANVNLTDSKGRHVLQVIFKLKQKRLEMLATFFQHVTWQKIIGGITPDDLVWKLNELNCTPKEVLHWGNVDLMKFVLSRDGTVIVRRYKHDKTLLHIAVQKEMAEMVKVLLDFGADVDALDDWKQTPICYVFDGSCKDNSPETLEMFKVLMSRATLLTTRNIFGFMQIFMVLQRGSEEAIDIILQSNVDLNATDRRGNTVLHYLAQNCNVDLYKLLRGREFNVNARNTHGDTPLHAAVEHGLFENVKFLLDNGADVNEANNVRYTPLYHMFYRHRAVKDEWLELFFHYGADPQTYVTVANGVYMTILDIVVSRIMFDPTLRARESNAYIDSAKPVIARLAVIEGLGTEITELTLSRIHVQQLWIEYFDRCRRQVERMKKSTFYGKITLLDFLSQSEKKILAYVRNEELVSKLEKAIDEVGSPCADLLRSHLAKAIQSAELKEKAFAAICWLANQKNGAFYFLANNIVEYLTIWDMKSLKIVWNEGSKFRKK